MSAVTLPGSIEGLLQRGSPVNFLLPMEGGSFQSLEGVIFSKGWDKSTVACAVGLVVIENSSLELDLEEDTGKQHAVWWLKDRGAKVNVDARYYESTNIMLAVKAKLKTRG